MIRKFAVLALVLGVSTTCASPASDQGQGGSTGTTPQNSVVIAFHGPVTVHATAAPTAAPASSASASQKADNKVTPSLALGDEAIKALAPAGGVLPPVTVTPPVVPVVTPEPPR